MLIKLRISNIILIESAEILFKPGFNVLSGETGSGKSAIMHALGLVVGDRADASVVRKGAEKGIVEAIFDIDALPDATMLLDESGIDHEAGSELIVRREILSTGRSRAFINNQMVQISLLSRLGAYLLDILGQHASQRLLDAQYYREVLDLFGGLQSQAYAFKESWSQENALREQLELLTNSEAQRLRDIDRYQSEWDELESAKLKEDEEEDLFAEYERLSHSDEIQSKLQEVYLALAGERQAVLPLLSRHKITFEYLVRLSPSLQETAKAYTESIVQLQEIAHTLRNASTHIESDPDRLHQISERLTLIDRLKKRYGSTIPEMTHYEQQLKTKLNDLTSTDIKIEEMKEQLDVLSKHNDQLCNALTAAREKASKSLQKAIVKELRDLNMPKVEFFCSLVPQQRSGHGSEKVEFTICPNVGEKAVPVRECASGGELSRLMLALQAILTGKSKVPTLIFDEIDANIGGETANVIGEKLQNIGKKHQVLCITHFLQVAKQADHHMQISKQEQNGRTVTLIQILDQNSRQKEFSRLIGA